MDRAKLIVFSGLPGAGKSAIAEVVAKQLHIPCFAKDWLEAPILRAEAVPRERLGWIGYEQLTALARRQLTLGQSVILDSVASTVSIRSTWRDLAAEFEAQFIVIECICSIESVHKARLSERKRDIPGWPELDWVEVERVRGYYEPWDEERLVLDSVEPLSTNVSRAARYVEDGGGGLGQIVPSPVAPDLEAWDAWDPPTVAGLLDGVGTPWCVVGGWALDLFRGEQTREHEDIEIAVPQSDFDLVRAKLADYEFWVAGSGGVWPLDEAGDAFFAHHQTWVREPSTGAWRLDVMRNPDDGGQWVCRRDRRIRRPYAEAMSFTSDGIPFLVPELVLLFKGKNTRPKDDEDLAATIRELNAETRSWLAGALEQVYGRDHRWIPALL
jgi:predicted kinase